FKKLFGLLVAGVDVGMVPPRKSAICLAYVFRLRITSHTKRFIVISLAHSGCEIAGDRSPASYAGPGHQPFGYFLSSTSTKSASITSSPPPALPPAAAPEAPAWFESPPPCPPDCEACWYMISASLCEDLTSLS